MNKIKTFIISNLDIILFLFLVLVKTIFMIANVSSTYTNYQFFLWPTIASLLFLGSFAFLMPKKKRTKYLYSCNLIITIFMVVDIEYFRYFKDLLSLMVLRNIFLLKSVSSSVKDVIKIRDFIYFADLVALPFIHRFKNNNAQEYSRKVKFSFFAVMLLLGILIDSYHIYGVSIDQPRLLTTMYNKVYIAKVLGSVNYHAIDIFDTAASKIQSSIPISKSKETEIVKYINSASTTDQNSNMKGYASGKNLIIIQVEALQEFVINQSVNGQEITPNLNRWIKKSTYFNNCFYQVAAGGTSDAEFMVNNSLYPASAGAAYYLYPSDTLNSIANVLDKKGYQTNVLHGYEQTFWNRNIMYNSEGFKNFYNKNDYNVNEVVGMGISDKAFLNQSIDKINNMKKPYYSFLITLSSHFPYDDTKGYGNFDVGKYEGTLIGNYFKGIHYTDEQLGIFLDKLEQEGILKDSMVVLYGDHYAIPREHQSELASYLNISNMDDCAWMKLQKVPLLIHFPGDAYKGVNNMYCGQMDIYPTIANLYNLSQVGLFGKDLFNTTEDTVTFRNGSFIDGSYYYNSQTGIYYDVSSGAKVNETSELKAKKEKVIKELGYSDDILNHNLFKKDLHK